MEKHGRQGWREMSGRFGAAVLPYGFAVAGLALGAGAIIENEPIAGACGAVAGVAAGLIQQHRARFHQAHAEALRERLRTHRIESEQVAAQLRQTLSGLQTELWQERMVALATPAYGLPVITAQPQPAAEPADRVMPAAEPAGRVIDLRDPVAAPADGVPVARESAEAEQVSQAS